jgi:hypothetical protein
MVLISQKLWKQGHDIYDIKYLFALKLLLYFIFLKMARFGYSAFCHIFTCIEIIILFYITFSLCYYVQIFRFFFISCFLNI